MASHQPCLLVFWLAGTVVRCVWPHPVFLVCVPVQMATLKNANVNIYESSTTFTYQHAKFCASLPHSSPAPIANTACLLCRDVGQ